MLAQAILKIEEQRATHKEGSLEYGIAEMLLELCRSDAAVAAAIAATDKTIADCAKKLWEYARNNKHGNAYGMLPKTAEKLIRSFYAIPAAGPAPQASPAPAAENPAGTGVVIDIMGLLAE